APARVGTRGEVTPSTRICTPPRGSTWPATSTGTSISPIPAINCSACRRPTARGTATESGRSTVPPSPPSSCSYRSHSCRCSSAEFSRRSGFSLTDIHKCQAKPDLRPPATTKRDAILSTATEELDLAELEELRSAHDRIRQQIARQIVGQDAVIEQLLMA